MQTIEHKNFFSQILGSKSFIFVPELNEYIDNLFLFLKNRKAEDIYLLTGNQLRLMAAMDSGFCVVPIVQYQSFMFNDY